LKPEEAKTMEEHLTKFHELFNEAGERMRLRLDSFQV
jgi:hypothetical protein